jgi:hypothetical protein
MVATRQDATDSRVTEKSVIILQNHPTFKGALVVVEVRRSGWSWHGWRWQIRRAKHGMNPRDWRRADKKS